jgi:hypothetical protein
MRNVAISDNFREGIFQLMSWFPSLTSESTFSELMHRSYPFAECGQRRVNPQTVCLHPDWFIKQLDSNLEVSMDKNRKVTTDLVRETDK